MRIAIDAMGGDYAPVEIVKGAVKAVHEYKDVEIILIGKQPLLHVLAGKKLKKLGISVVHAEQNIEFHEHPMEALRQKPNASIPLGIGMLKTGKADVFISAGSTGAVFAAAMVMLGKIEGVSRPAIASIINLSHSKLPTLLLDAGANADCRPPHLVQFAQLGNLYAGRIFGMEAPRIGLLSNGSEVTKGNRLTVEAHQMLKKSGLNFIGNIEGNDLVNDIADVIVTDGFTGNILLKALEGLGESLVKLHGGEKSRILGNPRLTGKALSNDVEVSSFLKNLDYSEFGGACLLGVKGNVIIAHGRSKARAIKNAIGIANRTAERSIAQALSEVEYEPGEEKPAV
jgi:glycerol-3-phosphate acyltransferase PlsX